MMSSRKPQLTTTEGEAGNGWAGVEIVLVRLNNSFVPSGQFPVFSKVPEIDAGGRETRVGYDAAVCVELYEPWVIEVFYNSDLGLVATVRIVEQANSIKSVLGEQNIGVGRKNGVPRVLNSTGKYPPFFVRLGFPHLWGWAIQSLILNGPTSHDNGINQMLKVRYPTKFSLIVSNTDLHEGQRFGCQVYPFPDSER